MDNLLEKLNKIIKQKQLLEAEAASNEKEIAEIKQELESKFGSNWEQKLQDLENQIREF